MIAAAINRDMPVGAQAFTNLSQELVSKISLIYTKHRILCKTLQNQLILTLTLFLHFIHTDY